MNNRRDPAEALGGEGGTGEFGVGGSSLHMETYRKRKIRVLAHLENLVLLGLLVTFGSGTPALWAQGPSNRDLYTVTGVQVETGPRIDGLLDDEVWRSAALIDQFTQQVISVVAEAQAAPRTRWQVFEEIWQVTAAAGAMGGDRPQRPSAGDVRQLVTIPYLTEPWYC